MLRRVGILFKSVQLLVLRHLRHELLEVYLLLGLLLVGLALLFSLLLASPACFQQLLLFLSLPLDVALHVCDFRLNEVKLLM